MSAEQNGISGYAAYLPAYRLSPKRTVAAFDEDATTLAVAAARELAQTDVPAVILATTTAPYSDKTNASAVHAALGLDPACLAIDCAGAARSGIGALETARALGGIAVLSDVISAQPGAADELGGGDGAAAFAFAPEGVIATVEGRVSRTEEFTDRWRSSGMPGSAQWEERFGAEIYQRLVRECVRELVGDAKPDYAVVDSPNSAVRKRAGRLVPAEKGTFGSPVGYAGTAGLGLALADVLDRAEPGETILVVSAADGCDAMLLRATSLLPEHRQRRSVADSLADGQQIDLPTYWDWRGIITRAAPRRPDPDRVSSPAAQRDGGWKLSLEGATCQDCGAVHLPPRRVCRECGSADRMTPRRIANLDGTVRTYTVDRLAHTPSPPLIDAVIDVDGGGRLLCEIADAQPADIDVGTRVGFSFRRLGTQSGIHNYFWKATLR